MDKQTITKIKKHMIKWSKVNSPDMTKDLKNFDYNAWNELIKFNVELKNKMEVK